MSDDFIKWFFIIVIFGVLGWAFAIWRTVYNFEVEGKGNFSLIKKGFFASPFGIKIYIIISYLMTMFFISYMFFPETVRERAQPFIGNIPFVFPYTLGVILPLLWISNAIKKYQLKGVRKMTISFCFFTIGGCVFNWIIASRNDYGNPYLMFSPYQWILNGLIPLAWVLYFMRRKTVEYFVSIN